MRAKIKITIGVAAGVLVLAGGGVAVATVADDDEISGPAADQARAAAVQAVPGGKADEVEADNDQPGAAYGVTVTQPGGSAVEVHLDSSFHVLGTKPAGKDDDGDD